MIELLAEAAPLVTLAADSDSPVWLLALGPVGGVITWLSIYRFYRNTDKSHRFEKETIVHAEPPTGDEQKVGENNGTTATEIKGSNVSRYRERVKRVG
jgi:hypothetical protein